MRHEESLGTSFTPSNNDTLTTVPWYLNKDNQNADLHGSRRSKISQKSNSAWTLQQNQPTYPIKNMSQRVTPEIFDDVSLTYFF